MNSPLFSPPPDEDISEVDIVQADFFTTLCVVFLALVTNMGMIPIPVNTARASAQAANQAQAVRVYLDADGTTRLGAPDAPPVSGADLASALEVGTAQDVVVIYEPGVTGHALNNVLVALPHESRTHLMMQAQD